MSKARRAVPHPEWVMMYRQGLNPGRIATLVDVPSTNAVGGDQSRLRPWDDEQGIDALHYRPPRHLIALQPP